MRRLLPVDTGETEIAPEKIYAVPELNFPTQGEANRPYIYFNMVSSADGKITTRMGNAEGLGTRTDRLLMQRLRAASDAVLVGAGTFRHDAITPEVKPEFADERQKYFPNNPQPLGMVLSNSGDLPLDNKFFRAGRERRVVFLGPKATAEAEQRLAEHAQVFRLSAGSSGEPSIAELLKIAFSSLKVRRLLVEGGPTLNYSFVSQGYADELFWTLAPKIVGGSENPTLVEGPGLGFDPNKLPQLKLISIYQEVNELFFRYKFVIT